MRHAPVLLLNALALSLASCTAGSAHEDEPVGTVSLHLGERFAETSPYCPDTDDWGAWGQTELGTWDDDVAPVVQWLIDLTGIHCSTYPGHSPSIGRAADWRPRSREEGTLFADWLMANARTDGGPLGIQYIIWQGEIYNIARSGEGVRQMEDRGSFTQNHCDHVHVSFVEAGSVRFEPDAVGRWGPEPPPPDAAPPAPDAPPAPPAPDAAGPPARDAGAPAQDAAPDEAARIDGGPRLPPPASAPGAPGPTLGPDGGAGAGPMLVTGGCAYTAAAGSSFDPALALWLALALRRRRAAA